MVKPFRNLTLILLSSFVSILIHAQLGPEVPFSLSIEPIHQRLQSLEING
jgi:hypothetical protein